MSTRPALSARAASKIELVAGEGLFLAVDAHGSRLAVDGETAEAQRRIGGGGATAAENGANARLQLARTEGFGQIVVGADLQSDDAIHLLAARGQHQDRRLGARADRAADLEAVDVGQHDVEDDGVERRAVERGEPVATGEAALDDEAGGGQVVRDHGGQPRVVVDDEKPLRHNASEPERLLTPCRARCQERRPPARRTAIVRPAPPAHHRAVARHVGDLGGELRALRRRELVGDVEQAADHRLGLRVEYRDRVDPQTLDGGAIDGRRGEQVERLFAQRLVVVGIAARSRRISPR